VSHFAIDSIWDRPAHREGFYYRSDHTPYAARNAPSLFFTTMLHGVYARRSTNPRGENIQSTR
jgi:hypothetical protein